MQNAIQKFRQSSIAFEKPGILSDELQLSYSSKCLQKNVWDFFILFRSWVINKSVKSECVETRSFLIFANNSRSKQNKKNPTHPFVDITK